MDHKLQLFKESLKSCLNAELVLRKLDIITDEMLFRADKLNTGNKLSLGESSDKTFQLKVLINSKYSERKTSS